MNGLAVRDVDFQGDTLRSVKDKFSNKVYVGVSYVCNGLGFSKSQKDSQVQKIQSDIVLKEGCRKFQAGVFDENNETLAIELDFLPLWLAKITITPTMRRDNHMLTEKLIQYQLKAKDVLAEAFIRDNGLSPELSFLQGMLDKMKDQEKRLIGVESKIKNTENKVVNIVEALTDTPDRTKINRKILEYSRIKSVKVNEVYNNVYNIMNDKYGMNIQVLTMNKNKKYNEERINNGLKELKNDKYKPIDIVFERRLKKEMMDIIIGLLNNK